MNSFSEFQVVLQASRVALFQSSLARNSVSFDFYIVIPEGWKKKFQVHSISDDALIFVGHRSVWFLIKKQLTIFCVPVVSTLSYRYFIEFFETLTSIESMS